LRFARGNTYIFDVSSVSPDQGFALRLSDAETSQVPGTLNNNPVDGKSSASDNRLIVYTVPFDAPTSIVYQSVTTSAMIGQILIGEPVITDTSATSATAGSNGDVPVQVAGYIVTTVNGNIAKIPYYND
jgi:hypothetical protein